MARNENMIAALKRERAIYVNAGDEDRIRQVDESLRHYGYDPKGEAEQDGPQERGTAPQQTADTAPGPERGEGGEAKLSSRKTSPRKTVTPEPPAAPPGV